MCKYCRIVYDLSILGFWHLQGVWEPAITKHSVLYMLYMGWDLGHLLHTYLWLSVIFNAPFLCPRT